MRNTLITALAATATLALTACGSDTADDRSDGTSSVTADDIIDAAGLGGDFDRDGMIQTMRAHGHDDEVATCMADGLTEQLVPYMYDEVVAAPTKDDVPPAWRGAYFYRLGLCDET